VARRKDDRPQSGVEANEESLASGGPSRRYAALKDIRVAIDAQDRRATFTRCRTVWPTTSLRKLSAEFTTVEQQAVYGATPKSVREFSEESPPV